MKLIFAGEPGAALCPGPARVGVARGGEARAVGSVQPAVRNRKRGVIPKLESLAPKNLTLALVYCHRKIRLIPERLFCHRRALVLLLFLLLLLVLIKSR